MSHLAKATIQVADNQVSYLAQRSRELDQETRMTCYTFNYKENIECIYYDKDVLRMQSLSGKYHTSGMTALVDATLRAITDLEQTATLYGDHAFLLYVLTDGQENASSYGAAQKLKDKLARLPDNWTVAVLVPDNNGVYEAKKFGFSADNIAKWDTTAKGIAEVGEMLQRQTDVYMTARSQGITVPRTGIFTMDLSNLSKSTVKTALDKLDKNQYNVYVVQGPEAIKPFVERMFGQYTIGNSFYEFTKREEIQPNKQIAILERSTGNVYTGSNARSMLGLPQGDYVKVTPADHPDFDLFVQSTSVNRKLIPGTNVLVLK